MLGYLRRGPLDGTPEWKLIRSRYGLPNIGFKTGPTKGGACFYVAELVADALLGLLLEVEEQLALLVVARLLGVLVGGEEERELLVPARGDGVADGLGGLLLALEDVSETLGVDSDLEHVILLCWFAALQVVSESKQT